MRENTIRELSVSELDMVGGGLSIPLPNPKTIIGDITKAISGVVGAAESFAGSLAKTLGSFFGGLF